MLRPLGYKREQRAKRDRAALSALVATPVTGDIAFTANARVYARSVSGNVAGATGASYNGRSVKLPALDAGEHALIGWIERGTVLTPGSGMEMLIDLGMGRFAQIGEAGGAGGIWGSEGSITVAEDVPNDSWGYNSYEALGSIVSPDPSFPILYMEMSTGGNFIYMDVQGDVVALLTGATITIKGQTFPMGAFSLAGGSGPDSTTSFVTVTGLISAADEGNTIPFTINLA